MSDRTWRQSVVRTLSTLAQEYRGERHFPTVFPPLLFICGWLNQRFERQFTFAENGQLVSALL